MTVILFVLISLVFHESLTRPERQVDELPKGTIVEKVICRGNPNQSYALYLPSNYTPVRKWPILYAFDPGARGRIPIEHYQVAAEKFGWIIVGSNNSRNGALQSSLDAWNAITKDTHERFAIDDRRMYTAGFSGGARVAILFATQCHDGVAGVIASGAGFPAGIQPAATMHFALLGTTGIDDFNFPEVKALDEQLGRAGIVHQIEVFDGRHEWPPSSVAMNALTWMELNAMKTARRDRDEVFVNKIWNDRLQQARALEASNKLYEAFQIYLEMNYSLRGLRDVSEIESKVSRLSSAREVRDAIRDEQQQTKKQRDIEAQIANLMSAKKGPLETNGNTNDAPLDSDIRLRSLLMDLRRQAKAESDSAMRRIARRILEGEFIGLFEQGSSLLQTQKRYDEAIRMFSLATEVNPDRAGAFYYLAWAYAAKGNKKKSFQALKTAIEKGFSDRAAITDNRAFDIIRGDPQYQKLIESLKNGQ